MKFNDLLLGSELNVVDIYDNLVAKTLSFISYVVDRFNFFYLMMCDDDTYVRLDSIQDLMETEPRRYEYKTCINYRILT